MATYLQIPVIKVSQPFGTFFITKIKAKQLLEISFPNKLRIINQEGKLEGNQREQQGKRIKEIANYINTVECAFPNSIILAANWSEDGDIVENEAIRWTLQKVSEDVFTLIIPTASKLASIIDGQHRLYGFENVDDEKKEMELTCSIYFDLPSSFQAYIFATINFNQKKVDKSLAYELYGYNLDTEEPKSWSPEKLAVYLTRKLNLEKDSAFYNHILIAPQNDNLIFEISPKKMNWHISTATIVEGIMKLYSQNHKRDRDLMYQLSVERGRSREMLSDDTTPFRKYYIEGNDLLIYKTINNFFWAANNRLFDHSDHDSYIKKTIGIQGLFDVLKEILLRTFEEEKNVTIEFFESFLGKVKHINFSDNFFQASGVGRSRIKRIILLANNFITIDDIGENEVADMKRLVGLEE